MVAAGSIRPLYLLHDIPQVPASHWQIGLAERALDWLISQYGPDASAADVWAAIRQHAAGNPDRQHDRQQHAAGESDRQEADSTDHNVGQDAPISEGAHTNDTADSHGGDGNSGECQHAAQTSAEDLAGSDSACNAGTTGDTPNPGHGIERAGDDASNGGTSGESSHGGTPEPGDDAQHGADQGGDRGADEVPASGMGSGADAAPGEECDHRQETADASASPGADDQSSDGTESFAAAVTEEGGARASIDRPTLAAVSELARVVRALSRLMADATRQEPCPLWDGKRLVRELVTHQVRLHRMRRDTPAVNGLLVIYDVSGSCEWIAARTWGIAEALAMRYKGFYAAQTPALSSDYANAEGSLDPSEIVGRDTKRFSKLPPIVGYGDDVDGWARVKAAGISHMLVFGDAHGTAGYRAAAKAGIRVLWANPNPDIAPSDTSWCAYTLIADGDIAGAVESLARRA
jgi:hypothetical protein